MGFLIGLVGFALLVYAIVQGALYGARGEYASGNYWLTWACLMMLGMILLGAGSGKKEGK